MAVGWLRNLFGGGARVVDAKAQVRLSDQAAGSVVRAKYDAAQSSHLNRRWWANADSLSALAAHSPQVRKTLRIRARYEYANNPYCTGMVQTLANDLIGTGPRLQLLDSGYNREIERDFARWCGAVRFSEKLQTLKKSKSVEGDSFLFLGNNPRNQNRVRLDFKVVESDQVATLGLTQETQLAVDGIDFDDWGNPERYHLLDCHPGTGSPTTSKPIPAEYVIHVFRVDRPGQVRGVPEYTAALDLFADLRRFRKATLTAAEIAARFPMQIYTDSPGIVPEEVAALDVLEIEDGAATTMPAGWKLAQLKAEHPATTYEMFKREILNEIARCLSIPYNVAAGNSSDHNYASGRLDFQVYFKMLKVERAYFESVVLDPIFAMWLREAAFAGMLPEQIGARCRMRSHVEAFFRAHNCRAPHRLTADDLPPVLDWMRENGREASADLLVRAADEGEGSVDMSETPDHGWFWDGHEHVDPKKEADAQDRRLANHTTTYAAEYGRQGLDWEEQLRQRAKELALMGQIGLTTAQAQSSPAEPDEDEQDDEAEDDEA